MRAFLTLSFILAISVQALFAQKTTCDCKSDLNFVVSKLKDMPSYKKQLKDGMLESFEPTYKNILSQLDQPVSVDTCFELLRNMILEVRDFHLALSMNHTHFSEDDIKDSTKIHSIVDSQIFKNHPKSMEDLEQLKKKLETTQSNEIEGIYKLSTSNIQVGLINNGDNQIEGIILYSDNPFWKKGQVILSGHKNEFGKYNLLVYRTSNKQMRMVNNITFENGRLYHLKKINNANNYEFITKKKSNWYFEQISDDIQYVYFGSFNSFSKKNRSDFNEFYKKHKNKFDAKHIIVDLRSNGGGNSKLSDPFLKLFKKSKAKIYILTNSFTASNSEHFTLKLKKIKGAKHLGQSTFGLISYGNNKGAGYTTPSGYFNFSPTDMDFHKYISYEGYGVTPDIKLDFDRDWLEQTKEIIHGSL